MFAQNVDQWGFWETAHLPLPWTKINSYFSLRAKCWLRGGVGGQFSSLFVRQSFDGVFVFKPTLTLRFFLNFRLPPLHCPLFVRENSFNEVLCAPQFVIGLEINFTVSCFYLFTGVVNLALYFKEIRSNSQLVYRVFMPIIALVLVIVPVFIVSVFLDSISYFGKSNSLEYLEELHMLLWDCLGGQERWITLYHFHLTGV